MDCRELYDSFMDYHKNNKENEAVGIAVEWLGKEDTNPFKSDTLEHGLFFKAKRALQKWNKGGIDYRVSRVRMERFIKELAQLEAANPYSADDAPKAVEAEPAAEEKADEKVIDSVLEGTPITNKEIDEALKKLEEPTVVLGVVPEQKPKFFKRRKE